MNPEHSKNEQAARERKQREDEDKKRREECERHQRDDTERLITQAAIISAALD